MLKRVVLILALVSFMYASSGEGVGMVKKLSGDVYAVRSSKNVRLKKGDIIKEGDTLMTKENGAVGVIFDDGTLLSLGKNSLLSVNKYLFKPSQNRYDIDLDMKKGLAGFESGKIGKLAPKSVKFRVPQGIVGIRGTKFFVEIR